MGLDRDGLLQHFSGHRLSGVLPLLTEEDAASAEPPARRLPKEISTLLSDCLFEDDEFILRRPEDYRMGSPRNRAIMDFTGGNRSSRAYDAMEAEISALIHEHEQYRSLKTLYDRIANREGVQAHARELLGWVNARPAPEEAASAFASILKESFAEGAPDAHTYLAYRTEYALGREYHFSDAYQLLECLASPERMEEIFSGYEQRCAALDSELLPQIKRYALGIVKNDHYLSELRRLDFLPRSQQALKQMVDTFNTLHQESSTPTADGPDFSLEHIGAAPRGKAQASFLLRGKGQDREEQAAQTLQACAALRRIFPFTELLQIDGEDAKTKPTLAKLSATDPDIITFLSELCRTMRPARSGAQAMAL